MSMNNVVDNKGGKPAWLGTARGKSLCVELVYA